MLADVLNGARRWHVEQGDCLDVLRSLPDASVDAVVTDPPYDLTANKRGGSGLASVNLDSPYGRARIGTGNGSGGFMGMSWDATGIAFRADLWAEALRVLKPGGHLVAFGGTRTYHRMACAIEDAGFEVRDSLHWMYSQGFPKATDKNKIPTGWSGWNTALKPSHEPIILARKPLVGTVAANVAAHGTGVLNIDGCRVATTDSTRRVNSAEMGYHGGNLAPVYTTGCDAGRWPPNILLSHTPECGDACAEDCAVAELDRQSGVRKSGKLEPHHKRSAPRLGTNAYGHDAGDPDSASGGRAFGGDEGGASRFFPVFRYEAKAARSERNARGVVNVHPTVKPIDLMRWLARLVTPPGGLVVDPFNGSGTTGIACVAEGFRYLGIEREAEYVAIARARIEEAASIPTQRALFGAT